MNIKEIWDKYQESGKRDPVLDGAIASFRDLTGMSIEDTIETIDAVASGDLSKLANYQPKISLFKVAANVGAQLAALLDVDDMKGAADFITKIVATGSEQNKKDLVTAFDSFTTDRRISNDDKQLLADHLKKNKTWNSFKLLYDDKIHHIRSANKTIGKAWIKDPKTFSYAVQEWQQAKHQNAPSYAKFHLLFKIIKIIVSRFAMIGTILGVLSLGYYGYQKAKGFFDNLGGTKKEITESKEEKSPSLLDKMFDSDSDKAEETKATSNNNSKSPADTTVKSDIVSPAGRALFDAMDKQLGAK